MIMKFKSCTFFDKVWSSIIELIIAVIYLVDVYLKVTNEAFSNNYWYLNLAMSVISILIAYIAVAEFVKKSADKLIRIVAFLYAVIISADTFLDDSAIGIAFISILLMNLIKKTKGVYKSVAQLFIVALVGVEIASILYLLDMVSVESILFDNMGVVWIDIVFSIAICLYFFMENKGNLKLQTIITLLPIIVVVLDVIFIEALGFSAYIRSNKYCVSANDIKVGTRVYIVSAADSDKALTYDGNMVTVSDFAKGKNQIFTFERAEEDGYWHIVTEDSLVLDIANAIYEDGNIVIAYDEIGLNSQHWEIDDVGSNLVRFVAYEPDYMLTWGNHVESDESESIRTLISSNPYDVNQVFFLRNAETLDTPFIDWIVEGNRAVTILVYGVIIGCVMLATIVLIVREQRNSLCAKLTE